MKSFFIAVALVVITCLAGVALGHAGKALFTGESFPPQPMTEKAVYYVRVPASSPISP